MAAAGGRHAGARRARRGFAGGGRGFPGTRLRLLRLGAARRCLLSDPKYNRTISLRIRGDAAGGRDRLVVDQRGGGGGHGAGRWQADGLGPVDRPVPAARPALTHRGRVLGGRDILDTAAAAAVRLEAPDTPPDVPLGACAMVRGVPARHVLRGDAGAGGGVWARLLARPRPRGVLGVAADLVRDRGECCAGAGPSGLAGAAGSALTAPVAAIGAGL